MLTTIPSSTPKTCLDAPKWIDSIPEFCCEKRLSDTDEKLMTAQGSLHVAAVIGTIQTAANFNKCKINVFILLIIFSANGIKIFIIVCACFVFVLSLIHVDNSTHTVLRAWELSYIIRYNYVQFHLRDHIANGTTFAKSLWWSV